MKAYEESLKTLRDNYATAQYVQTAVQTAMEKKETETITSLLELGLLTHEQIADSVKVPVEKVQAIAQKYPN
ncbi:MAG: hypothetical protein WA958_04325 [Tunicatimonas sp.]